MPEQYGQHVHGEILTGDATGAPAFTWYDQDGTVVTQGSTERVVLYWLHIRTGGVAFTVDVFFDADDDGAVDAGERVTPTTQLPANTDKFFRYAPEPRTGPEGAALKADTSATGTFHAVAGARILPRFRDAATS